VTRCSEWRRPSLRVYLPDPEIATGRMVIALPGGGYQHLAVFHEGYDWAPFFLSKGIAFAVLKYRMPNGNRDIPFADVRAAFAFVRQHAAEWKVDPSNIGIMGSSAGGHLASTFATHTTAPESPAFQILLYPVITMDPTFTHAGSRKNLLGDNPSREIADLYSNEKQVTAQTPRAFIIFAADDQTVPPSNGFRYAEALQKNKVALTFLLYPKGGHGFGIAIRLPISSSLCANWVNGSEVFKFGLAFWWLILMIRWFVDEKIGDVWIIPIRSSFASG